jgi:tRNA threonylcarbamoyladenosine biosynthesis protein TsaB
VAVPTFLAVAEQAPPDVGLLDVIADALRGSVYVQRFARLEGGKWTAVDELRIEPVEAWLARVPADGWVSGPGLEVYADRLPDPVRPVPTEAWHPGVAAVARVGRRLQPLDREGILALEPLYIRKSTAEEKADQRRP